jgi:hypothetical protein
MGAGLGYAAAAVTAAGRHGWLPVAEMIAARAPGKRENPNKAADIRATLARDLPTGTPVAQVLAYLDKAGAENSGFVAAERLINAIWRDVGRRGLVNQSVRADFHFDAEGRLTAFEVRDQFTGT